MRSYPKRIAFAQRLGFSLPHAKKLARLKTPNEIQTFINSIPPNFELDGDTCLSATEALRQKRAHCIEAAFIAAAALWMNGDPPLLMDFHGRRGDDDRVVALYRRYGCWGAISKSNHVWLRHRDPVYRTPRELAMSYFHDYIGKNLQCRNLWAYSAPFDLRRIDSAIWVGAKNRAGTSQQQSMRADIIALVSPGASSFCICANAIKSKRKPDKLIEHRKPRNMRKNKAKSQKSSLSTVALSTRIRAPSLA